MKTHSIQIGGNTIELKFGMGLLFALSNRWGCKGPGEVIRYFLSASASLVSTLNLAGITDAAAAEKAMQELPADTEIDIPFDYLNALVDVIQVAAEVNRCPSVPDYDTVADFVFKNTAECVAIQQLFIQSMPINRPEEKKPAGAVKAPKTKKAGPGL